jgi:fructuronate reductase
MNRLHPDRLAALPAAVARPRYDRASLRPGIVHLGVGAFQRAHLAAATEAALHANGDLRWGITGVSLRSASTAAALAPQQGLYTLALRDADVHGAPRETLQVIGVMPRVLVAPHEPEAVLQAIASEATRIVSLTVTEKGYHHDPATRTLRRADAEIEHDLHSADTPRTTLGFIVHGLQRRRARGQEPLTLLSLDNLPSNGDTLLALVLEFAAAWEAANPIPIATAGATRHSTTGVPASAMRRSADAPPSATGLAEWIATHCSFPNSMVDRIVPRTTEVDRERIGTTLGLDDAWPVVAEPFFDWVVEDRFAAGRPAWERGGVRFVDDVAPFERAKLRLVNGCHSAIAYLGALAGWSTVDEALAQPELRGYVERLMRDEIAPTLPATPGLDLDAYCARLLTRFANPALLHRTQQIAMDGSQKIPQRWLATVRDRLAAGAGIEHLALAVAGWMHYLRGADEAGRGYRIDDPLADALVQQLAQSAQAASEPERTARFCAYPPVFGALGAEARFVNAVARQHERLGVLGVRAALAALSRT